MGKSVKQRAVRLFAADAPGETVDASHCLSLTSL